MFTLVREEKGETGGVGGWRHAFVLAGGLGRVRVRVLVIVG